MTKSAVVIGGGIGGLSAAIALRKVGVDVTVLERAPGLEPVGSGISLWPNALNALDALGVGDAVRAVGAAQPGGGALRDRHGRLLGRTDGDAMAARFGPLLILHRADLSAALLNALPEDVVRLDTEVLAVSPDRSGVKVEHAHGMEHADFVVAADGIRSRVREELWDARPPRYAYTAWRFLSRYAGELPVGGETWGPGLRFGYARMRGDRVYAFATAAVPEGGRECSLADLRTRFAGWHDPIGALLADADPDTLMRHDVYRLPPLRTYVHRSGRVALLGDAAHAMTPDLGQGAGQSIEDAVVLAAALRDAMGVEEGLARYDAERRPRTQDVAAKAARVAGLFTHAPGWLNRLALRVLLSGDGLERLEPLLGWRAPRL